MTKYSLTVVKKIVNKPGWNEYVSESYKKSREIRKQWLYAGKPRTGVLYETHLKCKAEF